MQKHNLEIVHTVNKIHGETWELLIYNTEGTEGVFCPITAAQVQHLSLAKVHIHEEIN